MSDPIQYDSLQSTFEGQGPAAGLIALIESLRAAGNPHALFRALLLKKRSELGLPLINPGDLSGVPPETRKAYEAYVDEACRETGQAYLKEGKIVDAWRYFRTIGDRTSLREAIEKVDPQTAGDDVLQIALEEGVHPRRGFEIVLARDGICRAITLFDQMRSADLQVKRHAAGLLAEKLYAELVTGVAKQIHERFNETPPETDLVELVRHRPWLFENAHTHADPSHIAAVSRVGLLADAEPKLIMSLSISEYGRKLDKRHAAATEAPFEGGYDDHAKYARALLGQNVDEAIDHFTAKLVGYDTNGAELLATEWVIALVWRAGKHKRALELWSQYLGEQIPELPGTYIPSFYEMCTAAGEFTILADTARRQGDLTAWASAQMLMKGK